MQNYKTLGLLVVLSAFIACSSEQQDKISDDEMFKHLKAIEDEALKVDDDILADGCANSDINKFDQFLGVKYGMTEIDLNKAVGKFTGGEYSKDSLSFIYKYNRVENAPVAIWVNSKTYKVEVIFMEILTYEQYFHEDLAALKKKFKMSECDARFFGMTYQELISTLGKPNKEEDLEGGVKSVYYDSKDYKIAVNFRFFKDQGDICSSISVNWFY